MSKNIQIESQRGLSFKIIIIIYSNVDRINFMSSNVCIFTKQIYWWVQNYSHVSIYVYVNAFFVSKKMFIFIFVNLNVVFKIIMLYVIYL